MTEQEMLEIELLTRVHSAEEQKQRSKGLKTMSVREMGRLLGLRKTESYYLANQNLFKIDRSQGMMRVIIESFEEWYKNQDRYCKVGGPPPGKKLRQSSYSAKDISRMLGISEDRAWELISEQGLPVITVDYRIRVPKESFDWWYQHQNHYRNERDRERDSEMEASTLTMPEMARILGIPRNNVYTILKSSRNKGIFEFVTIAGRRRVTRESFDRWMAVQQKNCKPFSDVDAGRNYTVRDLQRKCNVDRKIVDSWIRQGFFPVIKIGGSYRIPCKAFDRWYAKKAAPSEGKE